MTWRPAWVWAALVLTVALPPALQWAIARPLGVGTEPFTAGFYEVAFLSSLGGGAVGLAVLAHTEPLLGRLATSERMRVELLVLLAGVASFAAPPVLVGLGLQPGSAAPAASLLAVALLTAQRAVLALALLRVPTLPGLRILLLVALGWWIPAFLPPTFAPDLERWIRLPLQLAETGLASETPWAWLVDMAPLVALLLAAWLGLGPARRRR